MIPATTVWVLVLVLGSSEDTSMRFTNQNSCTSAAQAIQSATGSTFNYAVCVEATDLMRK